MPNIKATDVREKTYKGDDIIVIDPCYVISWTAGLDEDWGDVCSAIGMCGTLHYRGKKVLYMQTMWGDGEYSVRHRDGSQIGTAPVDAGLLSVWKLSDALKVNPELNTNSGTIVRKFSGTIVVDAYKGAIEGDLRCNTAENECDEEDEDEFAEEDEF